MLAHETVCRSDEPGHFQTQPLPHVQRTGNGPWIDQLHRSVRAAATYSPGPKMHLHVCAGLHFARMPPWGEQGHASEKAAVDRLVKHRDRRTDMITACGDPCKLVIDCPSGLRVACLDFFSKAVSRMADRACPYDSCSGPVT